MDKPIPEAVAWPFSILEAGNWREVYMGTKHMRLEVSYPYEAWERLMAALTAAQQQQGQGGGEVVAWRVPVVQSPFGEWLDHGVRDELVLVMHRGTHGWKAAGQGHALLAHQLYVKNVEPLCATSHEVAVVGLSGGGWRTVWARSDDDVTHPAPPSVPVGVEAVRGAWLAAITLANNICVQESDRENDRDGDTGWIDGTAECAKRIREYAHPTDAELLEMLDEAGANAAKAALAQQPAAPVLAKHQPCGCVICTCEDEQQCQGCGAKHCGNRADHPPYVGQQPAAPSGEVVALPKLRRTHPSYSREEVQWVFGYNAALSDVMRLNQNTAIAAQHQEPKS